MKTFHVEIIKPSHYDKDGYVIQWWKAWIPSNSMACLYAIARDCAERRVLGEDVAIEVDAFDEMNVKLPMSASSRASNSPDMTASYVWPACNPINSRARWRSRAVFARRAWRWRSEVFISAAASPC